jgi:iron(III) transport system permease protein
VGIQHQARYPLLKVRLIENIAKEILRYKVSSELKTVNDRQPGSIGEWFRRSAFMKLQRPENIIMVVLGVIISLAILYPVAIVFWKSLHVDTGLFSSIFSLNNYTRFIQSNVLRAIGNSFVIALGSAFLATIFGVSLAWLTARTNMPGKRILQIFNIIPFFVSTLVGSIAWSLLLSPKIGLINTTIMHILGLQSGPFNIYSILGIIWVSALFNAPFVYLFCIGPLKHMDPAVEESARTSGSSWWQTTTRITLPLVAPALISSFILAFVLAIEDLGSPLVLGYPFGIQTISTMIYEGMSRFPPDYGFGAALGVLLVTTTVLAIVLQRRIMSSRSYATVTGRGYRPAQVNLGKGKYIALAVNILYVIFSVAFPVGILLVVSLSKGWTGVIDLNQFTLQYFNYVFFVNPLAVHGIVNSMILAVAGATIAMVLSTVIAYSIHRTKGRAGSWLDFITTLPIAISGMVMAIGLLEALIRTPLYGTLEIILVAYVIRFFTYGQRSISGVLISLSSDLEESSRMSGAGWITTVRRILVPLVWPGFIGGWILLFTTFTREVSMSLLLSRSGTETMSVALYNFIANTPFGALAAFTMVQIVILFIAAFILLRVTGGEGIQV